MVGDHKLRLTNKVRAGLRELRPFLAIALEVPGDTSSWCCVKGQGEQCNRCEQCKNFEAALTAMEWLDVYVFGDR